MSSYLYVLSIGPVQDFIAAARRTKDLWFGSHLLSEISKAAAKEIVNSGGKLIFPGLKKDDSRLEPETDFNVANIILAELELPENKKPSELNKEAQAAAKAEWEKFAERTRNMAESIIRKGSIWDVQVDDALEFNSAWVLRQGDYPSDRKKLMRLLAGRKSIRNFKQAKGIAGVPKSSLDGARESVLDKDKHLPLELAFKMRSSSGEQLCAIGLTKRLGGGKQISFPSVTRVSLDPWIRGLMKSGDNAEKLLKQIDYLCKNNPHIASGCGDYYSDFPYDGQVLYLSRLDAMLKLPKERKCSKGGWEDRLDEGDRDDLGKIRSLVKRLQKHSKDDGENTNLGLGEPDRYFAILSADGDRMGRVISSMKDLDIDKHIKFSAKLSKFAEKARAIVKDTHHGCMVYSGGDDVLAFLPLDTCLLAARDLHDCFGNMLEKYTDKEGKAPTLSVGVAIAHSMEPLEDILRYGREAEKAAKKGKILENETGSTDDRDGLAVHLHTRSGGEPIRIREQWDAKGKASLDKRLGQWADLLAADKIPDGAAYDIHELARSYQAWEGISGKELGELISKDALRLLKRKRTGQGKENLRKEEIDALLNGVESCEAISSLADELILSRKLAVSIKQSKGSTTSMGVRSQ